MIALGIDLSVRKLAIGGLRDDGTLTHHAFALDASLRGADRLVSLRRIAVAGLAPYASQAHVVLVEDVWRGELQRMAAVVEEAAKSTIPGAMVICLRPSQWKVWAIGHGDATKDALMAHAHRRGYDGDDQDIADALCMASGASERWQPQVEDAA